MSLGNVRLPLEVLGEGWVLVPFGFQINGTSNPDNLQPDNVFASWVRDEAGEFTGTLKSSIGKPKCLLAVALLSPTADDVDIYARCDWSSVASAGTLKVFCQTGATQTDPTDDTLVGGFLLCKTSGRGLI